MATRMTVHQAADLWRVNRRTILKWIMGKDASGRGKRLVEGEDYEVVDADIDGRKMYVLLRSDYPPPRNLNPIPRKPRGRQGPREAAVEAARGRTHFEQVASQVSPVEVVETVVEAAVPVGGDRYSQIDSQRFTPVAPPPPTTAEEAAEQFAVTQEAATPEVVTPKPKRRRSRREDVIPTIDTYLPAQPDRPEDEEEFQLPEKPIRSAVSPEYEGESIRTQIEKWVRASSNEDADQEDPVAALPRFLLSTSMEAVDIGSPFEFVKLGQPGIEAAMTRVLKASPMTDEARFFAGGVLLEYLANHPILKLRNLSPSPYWPRKGQLSGLGAIYALPLYDWML